MHSSQQERGKKPEIDPGLLVPDRILRSTNLLSGFTSGGVDLLLGVVAGIGKRTFIFSLDFHLTLA
jgi:hypothetical protein